MADLSARRDARIVAVVDPDGFSIGAGLAEVMGVPLHRSLDEVPRGAARYLVHPPLDDFVAPIVDQAGEFGLEAVPDEEGGDRLPVEGLDLQADQRPGPVEGFSDAGGLLEVEPADAVQEHFHRRAANDRVFDQQHPLPFEDLGQGRVLGAGRARRRLPDRRRNGEPAVRQRIRDFPR